MDNPLSIQFDGLLRRESGRDELPKFRLMFYIDGYPLDEAVNIRICVTPDDTLLDTARVLGWRAIAKMAEELKELAERSEANALSAIRR